MIPIQLTIQGLYSYQKKQTIDFKMLTNAHLFGIFGSVGSGKSSILEAITFALYGKTDRLNLSGDNRNYNMMNLKSNELIIDFEFETGKNPDSYRASVQGRRNSKQFEDVKKLDRSAYKKVVNQWIPIETSEMENAIGLSYENFKRTVIIPQGQFQEFLQLGNKDRTQMLKELFNLEKFELFYKVASLESKNNEQKQIIHGQLQQLGTIDPNLESVYQEQLKQLENELLEWTEKLANHQKKETEWQKIKELAEKFEAAKQVLENLQNQQHDFIQLEKNLQQYEKCVNQFKNILDTLEISNKKLTLKTEQIKADTTLLERKEAEIKSIESALAEIKTDYENRDLLKQRSDELQKILNLKDLSIQIQIEKERLEKGNKILVENAEKIKSLTSESENIAAEIKAEKLKLPDLSLLSKIKTWHVEKANLDKQKTENVTEAKKLQAEEKSLKENLQQLFGNSIFAGFHEERTISNAIGYLERKNETLKASLKSLEKEADQLRVKAQLGKFAKNLEGEKPCPLCGSTHHPKIYTAENIIDEQNQLEKTKLDLDTEIESIFRIISQLKDLELKMGSNAKNLNFWLKKTDENKTKTDEYDTHFQWPAFSNPLAIENAFASAETLQKSIKKKEDELEKTIAQQNKETKNRERFIEEIDKIKTAITVYQTETKTIVRHLKIVSIEEFEAISASEIEAEKEILQQKHTLLEKQYNDFTNQYTKLQETKNNLAGSLKANKNEFDLEQETNTNLQLQLKNELKKTDYSNIDEVKQVLSQPVDLVKQKQLLSDFNQKLSLAHARFTELQNEAGDRFYDAGDHQKIKEEIISCNNELTGKQEKSGEIKTLLRKLQEDIKAQAKLLDSFDKLELRSENLKTMKSLFKASGFVNYISSVYLQNLCNSANDRFFKLTGQKLGLEITDDNNFQVRDFLNGGKTRNVKTLSGGQTFQAALSLALALADNIQKITGSGQNFFFLDEGFGSLDKESLSVVFDTLKSLRSENRIVGVISHVEEMQQEIDVHLRIENKDDSGSMIFKSWVG